jgi:hypothetical protein
MCSRTVSTSASRWSVLAKHCAATLEAKCKQQKQRQLVREMCVVCCLLSVVCCLLSVVCCLLSVVCCLLSAVCADKEITDWCTRAELKDC